MHTLDLVLYKLKNKHVRNCCSLNVTISRFIPALNYGLDGESFFKSLYNQQSKLKEDVAAFNDTIRDTTTLLC